MKERELREHADCDFCNRKIWHTGLPLFWRLKVDRFGINLRAAQRQDHMAGFLGSSVLAAVMGPDEDMAKPMMETATLTMCETCAMEKVYVGMAALEKSTNDPVPNNAG